MMLHQSLISKHIVSACIYICKVGHRTESQAHNAPVKRTSQGLKPLLIWAEGFCAFLMTDRKSVV